MDFTLPKHPHLAATKGPVINVVMDGVGQGRGDAGDAVSLAYTPTLDWLAAKGADRRSLSLRAHGKAVGLPSDKDMGNSEVGHNALGAGRVFDQGAKRVGLAIEAGDIWDGAWADATAKVRASEEPLHFIGLLSDGNVHSHIEHLLTMIRRAHEDGVQAVRVHPLLDGRDVPATSALDYVDTLEALLSSMRDAGRDYRVASGGGRMRVTMDRYEADWAMVERGWKAHVRGEGRRFGSLREAVETLRGEQDEASDQNLPEFVIEHEGAPAGRIRDGASVIFFNFRGDRAIEITRAFEDDDFPFFDRGPRPDVLYLGMMQYDGDLALPTRFLVDPPSIDETLGEYMVKNGVPLIACSETQKYGHVTYFWNGNRSGHIDETRERYIEIPSHDTPFEDKPWMKAGEITDAVLEQLAQGQHRYARLNYANGDMVGHTGDLEAAILAVSTVDRCIARLVEFTKRTKGALIVTADHGNADEMFERHKKTKEFLLDEDGERRAKTSHSLNPVPCYIYTPERSVKLSNVQSPQIANVAATSLALLGLERPADYLPSLIEGA